MTTKEGEMGYKPTGKKDDTIDVTRKGRFCMMHGYEHKLTRSELSALFVVVCPVAIDWKPLVNCYEVAGYSELFEPCKPGTYVPMYVMEWNGEKWRAWPRGD